MSEAPRKDELPVPYDQITDSTDRHFMMVAKTVVFFGKLIVVLGVFAVVDTLFFSSPPVQVFYKDNLVLQAGVSKE